MNQKLVGTDIYIRRNGHGRRIKGLAAAPSPAADPAASCQKTACNQNGQKKCNRSPEFRFHLFPLLLPAKQRPRRHLHRLSKNVALCQRFFLQPLISRFPIAEHHYEKRYGG